MSTFQSRAEACQDRLDTIGADAVVLFPGPNLYYVSGFYTEPWDRHFFLFIPQEGTPYFVLPELFEEQVMEASWIDRAYTWTDEEGPEAALQAAKDTLGIDGGHLLLDDQMWEMFTQDIRDTFPDATFGLASDVFDGLRERKDEAEIEAIAEASSIADEVSEEIRALGSEAIGMTERELANEVEDLLIQRGAEGLAFDVSSSSGPNTARVFYHHGDREIQSGDPVLLDFGCVVDYYCSDQTRMVVFEGDPPEEFERVYKTVLEAHEAGVEAVEPGVPAETVEAAAHDVLEEYGYLEHTQHRTGHGVGLTVHEGPNVLNGNDEPLEPGMVFSVEPGVYFEGEFGVRIEDLVAVTEDGCRRLNDSPRTWKPL